MTLYEVLGVAQTATAADIDSAWRSIAARWHPDRFASRSAEEQELAAQRFKEASEARLVLTDPARRRAYDGDGDASTTDEAVFTQTMGRPPSDRERRGLAWLRFSRRFWR